MRFIQCIASHNTLFNNTIIQFKEGTNILYGESGSGKTRLVEAINHTVWNLLSSRVFSNDEINSINLNITISHNDKDFRIIRDKSGIEIQNLNDSSIASLNSSHGEEEIHSIMAKFDDSLYKLLSSVNHDVYRNTSYVSSPVNEKSFFPDFKTVLPLVLSDSTHFFNHRIFLNDFLKNEANPFTLNYNKIKKELKEMDHEIEIKNLRFSKFSKIEQEKDELFEEYSDYEKKTEELLNKIEKLKLLESQKEKYTLLSADKKKLNESFEAEKKLEENINHLLDCIKKQYPLFLSLDNAQKNSLPEIQTTFTSIQKTINLITKRKEAKAKTAQQWKKTMALVTITPLIAAIFFFLNRQISLYGLEALQLALYSSITASVAAISGLTALFFSLKKYDLKDLNEQKSEKDSHLVSLLEKNNIRIGKSSSTELYELILRFFQEFNSFEEMRAEISSLKRSMTPNYKKYYSEKINDVSQSLNNIEDKFLIECKAIGIKCPSIDEFNYDSINADFEHQIETLNEKSNGVKELLSRIDKELEQFNGSNKVGDELSSRRESVKTELNQIQKKVNTFDFIESIFKTILKEKETAFFNRFSETGYVFYSNLCGKNPTLDETEFKDILMKKTDIPLSPVQSHFLYLSLIITLNNFISPNSPSLPLIVDEPGLFMDKKRIDLLLPAVKKISDTRQVIIITHDSNTYESFGHRINIS